jgi:hypothetical protein
MLTDSRELTVGMSKASGIKSVNIWKTLTDLY